MSTDKTLKGLMREPTARDFKKGAALVSTKTEDEQIF